MLTYTSTALASLILSFTSLPCLDLGNNFVASFEPTQVTAQSSDLLSQAPELLARSFHQQLNHRGSGRGPDFSGIC
ncbi:MAG: hypothetical protein MUF49_26105 [Oculatellaceae cyanobacterium Prado106]|jgi:hypothetical protein|nr:hypothetical protein [Oculatellaceae cyanobacterium Prado106]